MSEQSQEPISTSGLGSSLERKLGAVRRKLVSVEVIRRLALAVSVALLGLALLTAVDFWTELPMSVRTSCLVTLAGLVGLLLLWALAGLATQRRDVETLALMVEENEPGFRSRLIASVQFLKGKASVPDHSAQGMVTRLVEDTESFARPLSLTEVVNTQRLWRALIIAILLVGLAAGGYLAGGALTQDLLKRAFLSDIPVPRETRVVWVTGDLKVGVGDSITVEAQVEGEVPSRGELRVRFATGEERDIVLERLEGEPGRYRATMENVQDSFDYVAAINDGRSERKEVRVLPRPTVESLVGTQRYPSYTNLSPATHRPGEFLLFPGSELELTIVASQPLRSGEIKLHGGGVNQVESSVDPEDARKLHARFAVKDDGLAGFSVELLDEEEMSSQDATVYRVDLLRDEPPKARLVRPSRQRTLVTEKARVLIGYEAEDRFGIDRVELWYAREEDLSDAVMVTLPISSKGVRKVAETFDWALATIDPPLQVGDEVSFWIEAFDRNSRTSSGSSGRRILKVVTPAEKRDDLLSRVGDSLGRVDRATEDQERLNAVLAEWIRIHGVQNADSNNNTNDHEPK